MRKDRLWQGIFLIYGLGRVYLLFFRGRGPDPGEAYWAQIARNYNLIPFRTVADFMDTLMKAEAYTAAWGAESYRYSATHAIVNLAGNVGMFFPLGFLLPQCAVGLQRLWKCLLAAMAIVLVVELLQLFTLTGAFDVDDLILNLGGAAVGYGLWRLLNRHR